MAPTKTEAAREYGDAPQEWSWGRGEELLPASKRITIKDLLAMADDETVAAMFYSIETTVAQVDWSHEGRDNGVRSDAAEALEGAKFADTLLSDMKFPFREYVENAVNFLLAGFSLGEVLFRMRNAETGSRYRDDLWGIKGIVEREQLTVQRWVVKDGEIVAFEQSGVTGTKTIPLWKCMHLTNKGGANRPQGKSLFRAAYRPYKMKRRVQDTEAIGMERDLCGLPVFKMPLADIEAAADVTTPAGKAARARVTAAMAATQDMRNNESGGLVLPSDTFEDEEGKPGAIAMYEFSIVTSAGSRTIDTRSAVRDYDLSMMRVAMMQFLRLGDRAGGSYALSDTQSSLAMRAIVSIISKIRDEWRQKALTTVWLLNGKDLRWLPELVSSAITEDSLEAIGQFVENIASALELAERDPELYEFLTEKLGLRRTKKAPSMEPPDPPAVEGVRTPAPADAP